MLKEYRADALLLTLLIIFSTVKFWQLDQGLAFGEPDAYALAQQAMQLADGTASLRDLDVYNAGWLLSWAALIRIVPDPFIAGRIIVAAASVILTATLYAYGRIRFSRFAGFAMALAFALAPLGMFYARYPLGHMLLALFGFLFFVFFDQAVAYAKPAMTVPAGVGLALATATKPAGFQFWFAPLLYLIFPVHCLNLKQWWRSTRMTLTWPIQLIPLLCLFTAGGTLLLLVLPFLLRDARINAVDVILGLFSRTRSTATPLDNFATYAGFLPYWLSLPFLAVAAIGLIKGPLIWGQKTITPIVFLILQLTVLFNSNVAARYFVPALPLLAIATGWGIVGLAEFLKKHSTLFQRMARAEIVATALFTLTVAPSTAHAFQATLKVKWTEQVQQSIRQANLPRATWVFSSYWPSVIVDPEKVGLDSTWLTTDSRDANTWLAGYYNPRQRLPVGSLDKKSPIQVLKQQGAVVVIEETYSRQFLSTPARKQAVEYVQNNYAPTFVIEDHSPNFPYTPAGTRVLLYIIPKPGN